jgi:hypothetical protein
MSRSLFPASHGVRRDTERFGKLLLRAARMPTNGIDIWPPAGLISSCILRIRHSDHFSFTSVFPMTSAPRKFGAAKFLVFSLMPECLPADAMPETNF